jgi:hypothetical protein
MGRLPSRASPARAIIARCCCAALRVRSNTGLSDSGIGNVSEYQFIFPVLRTLVFYRDKSGSRREERGHLFRECFHRFLQFSAFTGLCKFRRTSSRRRELSSQAGARKVSIFRYRKKWDTDMPMDGLPRKHTLPHTAWVVGLFLLPSIEVATA